ELVYQDEIKALAEQPMLSELVDNLSDRFLYIPVVTRENVEGCLGKRITNLIENKELEDKTGISLNKEDSRFMICGNPDMVKDIRKVLKAQGFSPARRNSPGEIAVENYW
ncbi:MAG: ferredoxin--NADP reductase, partial [Limnobacter sp.]|nr:ferredoxin--NADP reductase [Limnobacter sp.]